MKVQLVSSMEAISAHDISSQVRYGAYLKRVNCPGSCVDTIADVLPTFPCLDCCFGTHAGPNYGVVPAFWSRMFLDSCWLSKIVKVKARVLNMVYKVEKRSS